MQEINLDDHARFMSKAKPGTPPMTIEEARKEYRRSSNTIRRYDPAGGYFTFSEWVELGKKLGYRFVWP